jgi:short-subunit dehydrogenase
LRTNCNELFTPSLAALRNRAGDKTVLITGASDGIGRAVALACAKVGAEVLLLGRNEAGLEAVYDDI